MSVVLANGRASESRSWVRTAAAAFLAAGAIGIAVLVLTGMKDRAIYSKAVDDLMVQRARFVGRPVRVEGDLVHGTLEKRDSPCAYRFSLQRHGVELPVRYAGCVVPDTFRDVQSLDLSVTVEGELQRDGVFEATNVLAKCPSKYEMQQRKDRGEHLPHAPLAGDDLPSNAIGQVP
ncbi:MAG: cytochrome c maturation protein CcmE [Polyangiaceae bacterium]